jgi:hypothetical protein
MDLIKQKTINDIHVNPPPLEVAIKSLLTTPTNELFAKEHPNIFMVGKKEAGKTNLILNCLDKMVNPKTIIIVFCNTIAVGDIWKYIVGKYGKQMVTYDAIEETDKKSGKKINNLQSFMTRMENKKRNNEDNNYIVIFDDISDELRSPKVKAFLKQNRHLKCTCIVSSQSVKDLHPDAIGQCDYLILMNGIPDKGIDHVADKAKIYDVDMQKYYNISTKDPYNFLFCDIDKEEFRKNFNKKFMKHQLKYEESFPDPDPSEPDETSGDESSDEEESEEESD